MEAKKCLEPPESMEDVVKGLHVLFEEDHVNVEQVISFLESYRSNPADWAKYANYDPHRFEQTFCRLFMLREEELFVLYHFKCLFNVLGTPGTWWTKEMGNLT